MPRFVIAVTLTFAFLLGFWSVLTPLSEAPDEPAHIGLVLHLAAGNGYPAYDGLGTYASTVRLCHTYSASRCAAVNRYSAPPGFRREHPADRAPDKGSRPAWDAADGALFQEPPNQMPQHPPLYYQAMAMVLRVERALVPGTWSLDREVALLRLMSVLMVAPVPLLTWWAARRFGYADDEGMVAAVLPFAIPQLTHIGGTVNNDNLLVLLGAVVLGLLGGVVRGDRSMRTAIALGTATGLALLTKVFALFFPVVIVFAYWLGARRRPAGADGRTAWRPLLVCGAVSASIGVWWYAGNLLSTSNLVPSIADIRINAATRPPGFRPDAWSFAQDFAWHLTERFWGSFGWVSVQLSLAVTVGATVLTAACVVAATTSPLPQTTSLGGSERVRRLDLLAMLIPIGLFVSFVLARAWALHVESSRVVFIQGRYLYGALVGLLVVVAVGLRRLTGRWAVLVATGWGVAMQTEAIRRCLPGWWGGAGIGPSLQVRGAVAWSGWPGELLAAGALVALAAAVWLVGEVVRSGPGCLAGDTIPSQCRAL